MRCRPFHVGAIFVTCSLQFGMQWLWGVDGVSPKGPQAGSPTVANNKGASPPRPFDLYDQDRNATIDVEEFVAGSVGRAADNKRAEFQAWDLDHDGRLTLFEFRNRGQPVSTEFDPEQYFHYLDRDKNQSLTYKEFSTREEPYAGDLVTRFFELDADHNSAVSLAEYVAFHEANRQHQRWIRLRRWLIGLVVVVDVIAVVFLWPLVRARISQRRPKAATVPPRSLPSKIKS
jgi:Ca2+-binding EF-hand superfamily protein